MSPPPPSLWNDEKELNQQIRFNLSQNKNCLIFRKAWPISWPSFFVLGMPDGLIFQICSQHKTYTLMGKQSNG